jgi:hypothetical protein
MPNSPDGAALPRGYKCQPIKECADQYQDGKEAKWPKRSGTVVGGKVEEHKLGATFKPKRPAILGTL